MAKKCSLQEVFKTTDDEAIRKEITTQYEDAVKSIVDTALEGLEAKKGSTEWSNACKVADELATKLKGTDCTFIFGKPTGQTAVDQWSGGFAGITSDVTKFIDKEAPKISDCSPAGVLEALGEAAKKTVKAQLGGTAAAGTVTTPGIAAGSFKELAKGQSKEYDDDRAAMVKQLGDAAEELEEIIESIQITAFSEQCFVMAHIFQFVDWKESKDEFGVGGVHTDTTGKYVGAGKPVPKPDGVDNASLLITGSPYNFMNKLTQNSNYSTFFDISPAALSSLQPMIRLYKVIGDKDGNETEHEITFASHLGADYKGGAESLLKNKRQRGYGAGIKEFSFSYEGQDYFALKKSIKAKLVIVASDFDELLRERTADGAVYKYIDLALKTGGSQTAELNNKLNATSRASYNNLAKLNFRLKAVVGWASPGRKDHSEGTTELVKENLRDAIYDSYVTLQLTPTIHSFDLDDMGRVTFTLEYLAYTEDFFDNSSYNIFTQEQVIQNILKRNLDSAAFNKVCDSESNEKLKKDHNEQISEDKKRLYGDLMRRALDQEKIFFAPLKYEDIEKFNQHGPYFEYDYDAQIDAATPDMASEIVDDAAPRRAPPRSAVSEVLMPSSPNVINDPPWGWITRLFRR